MIVAPCYLKGRAFWGFAFLLLGIFAATTVSAFGKASADELRGLYSEGQVGVQGSGHCCRYHPEGPDHSVERIRYAPVG